jgi:hypothetical protein
MTNMHCAGSVLSMAQASLWACKIDINPKALINNPFVVIIAPLSFADTSIKIHWFDPINETRLFVACMQDINPEALMN